MNINKFTEKARDAVADAQQLAEQMNHAQIEPEHLLVALIEQKEGIIPELLRKMAADPAAAGRGARDLLAKFPQAYGGSQPGLSPRLKLVTDLAGAEADRLKDEYVSTEHLFVALADESGRSPGAELLKQHEEHRKSDGDRNRDTELRPILFLLLFLNRKLIPVLL